MKNQNQLGFTLLEIMLALLVVAVGFVAMTGLLGTSLDTSTKSHEDLAAVSFADMVFNHCQATDFAAIPTSGALSLPGYDGQTIDLELGQTNRFQSAQYTMSYFLSIAPPSATIKELTLQVWPGFSANGTPRVFYTEIYDWEK